MKYSVAALVAAVSFASAQREAAAYGQCGGRNHHGGTGCQTGFKCHQYNEWYSQCVPGEASSSSAADVPAPPTSLPSEPSSSKCSTQITISRGTAASQLPWNSANATYGGGPTGTGAWGSVTYSAPIATGPSTTDAVSSSSSSVSIPPYPTTLQTKAYTSANATSAVASAPAESSAPASSNGTSGGTVGAATGSYPSASGTKFVVDGVTGYFAGTNTYWISFLTNNDDVDLVMQHLQESGLKILRVWGFNDVTSTPSSGTVYFQSFAGGEPTINTGSNGLERLDYVVKSAEAHGIKLIINFVNNWTDYGGMAAYYSYAGISSNKEWYTSEKAQTQYQAYIKAVVSRYPDSSAIFAWELANEPRCESCDLDIMTTWITNTAKYIKSIDANRMVTTGEEGFGLSTGDDGTYPYTTGAGGYSFETNCGIADIDFCVYHMYPENWSVSPTEDWGNDWITNHGKACEAAGKPCLLEEYGAKDIGSIEPGWQKTAISSTGTGADLFWQYGDTLSTGKTADDGFSIFYGTDLYTTLVTDHVSAIDAA